MASLKFRSVLEVFHEPPVRYPTVVKYYLVLWMALFDEYSFNSIQAVVDSGHSSLR